MARKVLDSAIIVLFSPFFGMMFGSIFGGIIFLPFLFVIPLFADPGVIFDSYRVVVLWIGAIVGLIVGSVYVYETYWSI